VLLVRNRVASRDLAHLDEELLGLRVCAGAVNTILARTADALWGCL
jgi:hypothetical protein